MPIPEIPGIKAEPQLAEKFKTEISGLLERGQKSFPGAQPVSFARRHIQELQKRDYYLCEKTDGIRCLLYFTNEGPREIHYLIDRKNDYYFVDGLHFPLPGDDVSTFHTNTIIDGELVYDKEKDGSLRMRFLVFDCLTLDGKLQTTKPLDKRLAYFREHVFKPWEHLFKVRFPDERQHLPFEIEFKEMSFPYAMSWMFDIKLGQLKHGNDGLIFTCRETPYVFGTDEHILKWKPAHENTVDFRLKLGDFPPLTANGSGEAEAQEPDYDAKPSFELMVFHGRGVYQFFEHLYLTDDDWEAMKATNSQLDGRIIECYKDSEHRWRFKRSDDGSPHFRDDKTEANHISTVQSVLESIDDAVSQEDLVRNEGRIRDTFKKRQAERERIEREKRKKWEEEEAKRKASKKRGSADPEGASNGQHVEKRPRPE